MTPEQVKNLKPGDSVFWMDPARRAFSNVGDCSKVIIIKEIIEKGEHFMLIGTDGSETECYPSELRELTPSEFIENVCSEKEREFIRFCLDDEVHDAKAEEASKINNEGIESQLAYLGATMSLIKESC